MNDQSKTSETAVVTASLRALACYEDDELIRCKDQLAVLFLPDDKKESLMSGDFRQMIKTAIPDGLYEYVIARTAYFDELVTDFLGKGVPQIVFLGAGYDSRPYRFKNLIGNTLIFEVDALATQERKRSILFNNKIHRPENLRYVSLDFEQDELMNALFKEGFDPALQTLFIWEGVTFYLHPDTVRDILHTLRLNSALHSIISFDFQSVSNEQGLIDTGLQAETIRFGITSETTVGDYLMDLGYAVREHLDSEEMSKRYLTLSNGSRLGMIKSIMNIVKAEMT